MRRTPRPRKGDTTAPVITSVNTRSNVENTTLSHSLTANEAVTWSIVGGADKARFELSGSALQWAGNGTKDYESPNDANADNAYVVTVRATDRSGNIADQTITVTVTDADEVAPTITSFNNVSVVENVTLSHSLTADESVTWSIVGEADQGKFEISDSTLRFTANATKDYEVPDDADADNAYVVTVRATDAAGNTADQTITVTVTDVDEATGTVADQTISFGALTLANAGGAKALGDDGETEFNFVQVLSQGTGSGWGVSGAGRLVRTTGTPASQNDVVLTCTVTGGASISVTIQSSGTVVIGNASIDLSIAKSVATASEFKAALTAADGGEILMLRSGSYDMVTGYSFNTLTNDFASTVTIISHDPNNMAIINRFFFQSTVAGTPGHVDFRYIHFYRSWTEAIAAGGGLHLVHVLIGSSARAASIGFYDCRFSSGLGKARLGVTGPTSDVQFNWAIRCDLGTTGLTIEDCVVTEMVHAFELAGSNISCKRNEIYNLWGDGFHLNPTVDDQDTTGVLIEDNYYHDPVGDGAHIHGDFVQGYNRSSDVGDVRDVEIRGNVVLFGTEGPLQPPVPNANPAAVLPSLQGVFLQELNGGTYDGITIEGNLIVIPNVHGITFEIDATNVSVRNNTVVRAFVGDQNSSGTITTLDGWNTTQAPRIRVRGDATVVVEGNVAEGVDAVAGTPNIGSNYTGISYDGTVAGTLARYQAAFQGTTFSPANRSAALNEFRMKANGPLDADNSGTPTLGDHGAVGTTDDNGYWEFTSKQLNPVFQ